MKINWFCPVPPMPSAIAETTATVLPALAQRVEVTLWVSQPNWASHLEQWVPVRHYDPDNLPWSDINAADATIYHIGNSAEHHGPTWQVLRQQPGIVVLHDLSVQYLFAGLVVKNFGLTRSEYFDMMEFHHPGIGRKAAEALFEGTRKVENISEDCPLTGAALENAIGVIVHTELGCSFLRNWTTMPVGYVPLCANIADFGPEAPAQLIESVGHAKPERNEPFHRIIMFGFLSANRRLESVLKALRDFPQKDQFRLDIYGTLAEEELIGRMISDFALDRLVTIRGFVSPAELRNALLSSALAINLRDPSMGEASQTQLQIWKHGVPSLVTELGWYATLPKNTVATVRRAAELEDIQGHLTNFLREPETYRQIGRNGQRYLAEHHQIDHYVKALLEFIDQTLRAKPGQAISWMTGRIGSVIRPWFDEDAAGVLLPRVARAISDVFD